MTSHSMKQAFTDAAMKQVVRFEQLREFSLSANEVTDAGLMELLAVKQLKRVAVFPRALPTDS